jgi:hypothetical protein
MPSSSAVPVIPLSRVKKMADVIKEMLGSVRTEYANARASHKERGLLRH